MENEPLLSVIVPCYNSEMTVGNTLQNVREELGNNINYEIIVVNDGSTDNSEQIILQQKAKNAKIKNFSKSNGGLSEARNFGLTKAKGVYVWFFDADDLLFKGSGQRLCNLLKKYAPDLMNFGSVTVDATNKDRIDNLGNLGKEKIIYTGIYKDYILKEKTKIFVWSLIIKRELLVKNNITFEPSLYGCEDGYWNLIVGKYCGNSKYINTDLKVVKYIVHNQSITNTINPHRTKRALYGYFALQNFLKDFKVKDFEYLINSIEAIRMATVEKTITRLLATSTNVPETKEIICKIKSNINPAKDNNKIVKVFNVIAISPYSAKMAQFLFRNIFLRYIKPRLGRN